MVVERHGCEGQPPKSGACDNDCKNCQTGAMRSDIVKLEVTLFLQPQDTTDPVMLKYGHPSPGSAVKHALEVAVANLNEIVSDDKRCIAAASVRRVGGFEAAILTAQLGSQLMNGEAGLAVRQKGEGDGAGTGKG